MTPVTHDGPQLMSLARRTRLVVLLDAAESAGLTPIGILRLHAFAYLSNVLAPVWNLSPLDGSLLKRRGGPFYPSLQHDLDRLVGMGVALVSHISHVRDEEKRWRLEGAYVLNSAFAAPILNYLGARAESRWLSSFVHELAYALSALDGTELDKAFSEDATYSDADVDTGNVLDFAEWRDVNYSSRAAKFFDRVMPRGSRATPGEILHLYVRHLHRRINDKRSL